MPDVTSWSALSIAASDHCFLLGTEEALGGLLCVVPPRSIRLYTGGKVFWNNKKSMQNVRYTSTHRHKSNRLPFYGDHSCQTVNAASLECFLTARLKTDGNHVRLVNCRRSHTWMWLLCMRTRSTTWQRPQRMALEHCLPDFSVVLRYQNITVRTFGGVVRKQVVSDEWWGTLIGLH